MSPFLGAIPFDRQVKLFTEWLFLSDVCNFDSAACESTVRKQYLDVISSNEVVLSEDIAYATVGRQLGFVSIREEELLEWLIFCSSEPNVSK